MTVRLLDPSRRSRWSCAACRPLRLLTQHRQFHRTRTGMDSHQLIRHLKGGHRWGSGPGRPGPARAERGGLGRGVRRPQGACPLISRSSKGILNATTLSWWPMLRLRRDRRVPPTAPRHRESFGSQWYATKRELTPFLPRTIPLAWGVG